MKVNEIIKDTVWMPNPAGAQSAPKFSILMPVYRRYASGHLTRAIQSVIDQTYGEFELIIVDDCSVDGSFDEVQRFMKLDARIHCLHHPRNVGLPAIGCYEAYLKSRGEYLMFCFDDTEYQKNALERVEQYVSKLEPKIAFGYIDYQYQDVNGKTGYSYLGKEQISQAYLKGTNFLPNLGAILHRDVPVEIGFLDPHLAVARMTDWDYWKRAANVYELYYSEIHIGTEFGLVTNNSLGLTYPLNPWMAYEWTERDRNSALTPGRYEEYDVQVISEDLSDQSKLALHDISRFYESKFWYQPLLSLTLANSIEIIGLDRNDRVLVVTSEMDASISLAFEFIFGVKQNIRYVSPKYLSPKEMISASVVIFAKDLFSTEIRPWVEVARQLGVHHYYYLDDNFIVLNRGVSERREYTGKKMRKELATFNGVLVSSQELVTFFLENKIHSKVYFFPPVLPSDKWLDRSMIPRKASGVTRIGFMGDPHRHKGFIEFVLPAIARLAKDHAVELVVGGNFNISTDDYPQLKIYQFPFDISYRLTLGRMQSADIDIIVHSDGITRNNPYKTRNALLNACALKAFPILSNLPPYEDVEDFGLGLLCDGKDSDGWYEKLLQVISEPALVVQVRENLHRYVLENYSGRQNLDVLKIISKENQAPGSSVIENRFRNYIDIVERGLDISGNILSVRSAVRLVRKLEYKLHPQFPHWVGFEFMVGTNNQVALGQIEIEVLDQTNSGVVRREILEMKDVSDNQIVSVSFDKIPDSADKDYIVRFTYQTSGPRSLISIYETSGQESKVNRILRRVGILTRGNVLACRLLYAED